MLIDLVQLRTFVAVAEEQHLTRAAERIHISQSAASAHVRAIEEALRIQLFVRTNRSLELTQAGQQLFPKAKSLLNEASLFVSYARELRGEVEGTLIIGASGDPGANRIGEMTAKLRERHPLVKMDLRARPSSGIRQGLKSGEMDIGLLLDRPTDASFQYYELTTVYFRLVGPVAWKEQIETADWATLAALPWITPGDESMSYAVMQRALFNDRGLELNSVISFNNAAIARNAAQAGGGMMLMREDHALEGAQAGTLAISPLARPEYAYYVSHLTTRKNDPLIRAFVEAAHHTWPQMKLHGT